MIEQAMMVFGSGVEHKIAPEECIGFMTEFLRGLGWVRREAITKQFGWDERFCRAIRQAAGGSIISGNKGYILTRECNAGDFAEFRGRMNGQIKAMQKSLIEAERAYHGGPYGGV